MLWSRCTLLRGLLLGARSTLRSRCGLRSLLGRISGWRRRPLRFRCRIGRSPRPSVRDELRIIQLALFSIGENRISLVDFPGLLFSVTLEVSGGVRHTVGMNLPNLAGLPPQPTGRANLPNSLACSIPAVWMRPSLPNRDRAIRSAFSSSSSLAPQIFRVPRP